MVAAGRRGQAEAGRWKKEGRKQGTNETLMQAGRREAGQQPEPGSSKGTILGRKSFVCC